ncbi:outer membrane beta-barrel protein [Urechidicola croceus]|uniref:Uncharacterized protein n=1 Tax=Urechidicola croceus TaxID=1850246 RepID=A0A1D8P9F3_9FLAO|nr:outer membrane beta-barrel protein [Urechidicola croceus]AOW21201.1 hypothetical protein LPB138_11140 [Urechidicola croceus]
MNVLVYSKITISLLLFITINQNLFSQDENDKWILGIGMNAVDFYPTNEPDIGNDGGLFNGITNAKDHWNVSIPTLSVTRYLKNKFSADASISISKLTKIGDIEVDELSYFGIDGSIQYRFLEISNKLVPYVYAGGGYTWVDSKGSGTVNLGLGTNYWFTDKFGARVQAGYKHSDRKHEQLLSHFLYSFSVVFKLNSGRGKSSSSRMTGSCY